MSHLPFQAKVGRIIDGDSLIVHPMEGDVEIRVRLFGCQAPELDKPGGAESKLGLERMLPAGVTVQVEPHGRDRYRRLLATIRPVTWSVADRLIEEGLATHYEDRGAPSAG